MSEIASAIKAICDEKGLSYEAVLTTIESALAAAYRKDYGKKNQNIVVEFKPETGKSRVFDVKTVVEDMPEELIEDIDEDNDAKEEAKEEEKKAFPKEKKEEETETKESAASEVVESGEESPADEAPEDEEERKFNPKTEIQISDARMIKKTAKIGDEIKMKLEVPEAYGRMAAQTAKQVIIQRLREAEREMVYNDFKEKEREVVSGVVQRREGNLVLIDLGKTVGVLPIDEQIRGENYTPGERIKVYVKEVSLRPKGPEIVLSRTSEEILKKVFYLEIPEISNGLIELKGVAREAGARSKVAVQAESDNVDPIGSCVGQRGARIQTIIAELGGEKVDIIEYSDEPLSYISNALSPAKIGAIKIDEKNKKATVTVAADQLSLAIGKGGQNARLAAKLTGWKIDIVEGKSKKDEEESSSANLPAQTGATDDKEKPAKKDKEGKEDEKNNDDLKVEDDQKDKKSKESKDSAGAEKKKIEKKKLESKDKDEKAVDKEETNSEDKEPAPARQSEGEEEAQGETVGKETKEE